MYPFRRGIYIVANLIEANKEIASKVSIGNLQP